jgi:hypothetical protein
MSVAVRSSRVGDSWRVVVHRNQAASFPLGWDSPAEWTLEFGGQTKMTELVERMLDPSAGSGQALHEQLPKAKTPHGQESLRRTAASPNRPVA